MRQSVSWAWAAALVTSAFGCAVGGEVTDDALPAGSPEISSTQAALTAPFVVSVVPEVGTGCPAGTWVTNVAPDGITFTTGFSAFEASVTPPGLPTDPSVAESTVECKQAINFSATSDVQYSLGSFQYAGYVYLEPEVKAKIVTSYKFSNTQERIKEHEKFVATAPNAIDRDYKFSDDVALPNGEWTKCRKKEVLKLNTKLTVTNAPNLKGTGYINLASVDGAFTVRARPCTP